MLIKPLLQIIKSPLRSICGLLMICVIPMATAKPAATVKTSVVRAEGKPTETLILPYAFSTEGMGLVAGLGYMRKGFLQPQMVSAITAFGGEESKAAAIGIWNFRLPYTQRWHLSFIAMNGEYPRNKAYTSGNAYFDNTSARPGSNESDKEQFVQGAGVSNWTDLRLEYALPFGATRDSGTVNYQLQRGLLASKPGGGSEWNPLTSGASVLIFRQYNRHQTFEQDSIIHSGKVRAASLGLLYDNTDLPLNPEQGSSQYIALHRSADTSDNSNAWDFAELELSKYYSLVSSDWARQRVQAFNTWLAYSPSWKVENNEQGQSRIIDGPPHNEGATLGGFYRMRGFDQNRFHDKAAFYATAEYRYTLEYNPIENVRWLRFLNMDWAQLAFFAEAGRVAPKMDSSLLQDMQFDGGIGIRALMAGIVVRFDMAYSKEGFTGWAMIGHPF